MSPLSRIARSSLMLWPLLPIARRQILLDDLSAAIATAQGTTSPSAIKLSAFRKVTGAVRDAVRDAVMDAVLHQDPVPPTLLSRIALLIRIALPLDSRPFFLRIALPSGLLSLKNNGTPSIRCSIR